MLLPFISGDDISRYCLDLYTRKESLQQCADIIFIGTAIVDVIIRGFDPEPASVTGYRADSCSINIGGEAVNGAIAAAKLGARSAILCHLGNDAAGAMIEDELVRQGVDVSRIVRSDGHATPVTTMFVAGDGSRKSITNLAHKYNFHPELSTYLKISLSRFNNLK